ncbi:hypothetical protein PsorP6_017331 [Peronosclerospora sorghi]|uniref:Uncharacterized protein n=1 Tax=Peronosclerospora sorghi TaxID=230839 RepID=A0ACC0WMS9_9STRA|nr:hypothetical protein PsorP6_017331 [Peronosclerospora sorghi]
MRLYPVALMAFVASTEGLQVVPNSDSRRENIVTGEQPDVDGKTDRFLARESTYYSPATQYYYNEEEEGDYEQADEEEEDDYEETDDEEEEESDDQERRIKLFKKFGKKKKKRKRHHGSRESDEVTTPEPVVERPSLGKRIRTGLMNGLFD